MRKSLLYQKTVLSAPRWIYLSILGLCQSHGHLRAVIREDMAFTNSVLMGANEEWLQSHWRVENKKILGILNPSFLACSLLLARHSSPIRFFVLWVMLVPISSLVRWFKKDDSKNEHNEH